MPASSRAWCGVRPQVTRSPGRGGRPPGAGQCFPRSRSSAHGVEMWQTCRVPAKPAARASSLWSSTEATSAAGGRARAWLTGGAGAHSVGLRSDCFSQCTASTPVYPSAARVLYTSACDVPAPRSPCHPWSGPRTSSGRPPGGKGRATRAPPPRSAAAPR